GDGYGDLGVADHASQVYVFHSLGAAGVPSGDVAGASTMLFGTSSQEEFGPALAVGAINGAGYAAVVARTVANLPQHAYLFNSAGAAGNATTADPAATTTLAGTVEFNGFGMSVAVRDLDADGSADVVGVAEERAFVFRTRGSAGVQSADDTDAT